MTFPYIVIPKYEQEPMMERGDTLAFWIKITDKDSTATDPSTCSLSVIDPCRNTLLAYTDMTKDSVGNYYYNYNISATAMYGKYTLRVKMTDGTNATIYNNEMFVMPWNLMDETRYKSGVADTKTIPNNRLANLCWSAYREALSDVFIRHDKQQPMRNPATGVLYDGSNTSFRTKHYPLADKDGDGTVTGWGQQSCSTDVNCEWYDSNDAWNQGKVTVTEAKGGEITVTQTDGSAIPQNNNGVYLYYQEEPHEYNEALFRDAVAYLAAHNVMETLKGLDRVTLADIDRNKVMIEKDANRFKRKYRELLSKTVRPRIAGTR